LDHTHQPSLEIVHSLIEKGADVNAPSGTAWNGTAMEIAFRQFRQATGFGSELFDVLILLHRQGGLLNDEDFEILFQFPWFIEGITCAGIYDTASGQDSMILD
jgi:hypothetical protein